MSESNHDVPSDQDLNDFLAQLLGGGGPSYSNSDADPAVEARFDELAPEVNSTLSYLSGRIEDGEGSEGEYTFTLNVEQTRWVLSAVGHFIANEVRTEPEIAGPLFDATEKILAATTVDA